MTEHDQTLGEIGRSVARIEGTVRELSGQLSAFIGPMEALKVRMASAESDILDVSKKLDHIETRSAAIAGGVGVVAFILQFVPGWLKH